MLENILFVLIETSHPGNIGSAARAINTMGLQRLCLVNPQEYPSVKATARASGAHGLLAQAEIHPCTESAIAKSTLVIGASARDRRLSWPELSPREMADLVTSHVSKTGTEVAILFGRENNGLSNEELALCHYLVQIPANPAYSSLNLAAAVQVLAYEIRMSYLACNQHSNVILGKEPESDKGLLKMDSPLANQDSMNRMYVHLHRVLSELSFINEKQPDKLIRRIKRLFNRAQMEEKEVQIIRGILSAIEKNIENNQPDRQ